MIEHLYSGNIRNVGNIFMKLAVERIGLEIIVYHSTSHHQTHKQIGGPLTLYYTSIHDFWYVIAVNGSLIIILFLTRSLISVLECRPL